MNQRTLRLLSICSTAMLAALPAWAQTSPLPAANPSVSAGVSQEAKEKAEDSALLQQLDSEQPSRNDSKPKKPWPTGATMRGAGGGNAFGVSPAAPGVSYRVENLLGRPTSAPRALVVRTADADPKAQAALEEDLAVMSHILNKALEELPGGHGNGNKVMGIDVFFTPGSAPLRSLYLDNYGAVFFLNVNFPLIAPPEKKTEEKPVGDSTWEDARQEVYGQRGPGIGELAEDYSQEKVDKLKDALFEALKNATNIRGLNPEEFVTIWVSGGTSASMSRMRVFKANNREGNKEGNVVATEPISPARRTVLTIRVRKSEIDAYSKGKLSEQEFQKHARVTAYTGDSPGTTPDTIGMGSYSGRARF